MLGIDINSDLADLSLRKLYYNGNYDALNSYFGYTNWTSLMHNNNTYLYSAFLWSELTQSAVKYGGGEGYANITDIQSSSITLMLN